MKQNKLSKKATVMNWPLILLFIFLCGLEGRSQEFKSSVEENSSFPPPGFQFSINSGNGEIFPLRYADIAQADALSICPLAPSVAARFLKLSREMVDKVKQSVNSLQATLQGKCTDIQSRLQKSSSTAHSNLEKTLAVEFKKEKPEPTKTEAEDHSAAQASAVNEFLLTAGEAITAECISGGVGKEEFQQMIAEAGTLAGFAIGGTKGLGVTFLSQIFGRLPLFPNPLKKALKGIGEFEANEIRSSSLCFYRELAKSSCVLHQAPHNDIIHGVDLTFKTGRTKKALEVYKKYSDNPEHPEYKKLLYDFNVLSRVIKFPTKIDENPEVIAFCERTKILENFSSGDLLFGAAIVGTETEFKGRLANMLNPARNAFTSLINTCQEFEELNFGTIKTIPENMEKLKIFYHEILKEKNSRTFYGELAAAKAGFDKFGDMAQQIEEINSVPNQMIVDIGKLSENLAGNLEEDILEKLMKSNAKIIEKTSNNEGNTAVKQRAILAMVDICKTIDPTLVCMTPLRPEESTSVKSWKKYCHGVDSFLCDKMRNQGGNGIPLDPKTVQYINRNCWKVEMVK